MASRADMVARKLKIETEIEQEARKFCKSDDEECMTMAKALVKIRKVAESQRKYRAFEKYAYSDIDETLKEAGF